MRITTFLLFMLFAIASQAQHGGEIKASLKDDTLTVKSAAPPDCDPDSIAGYQWNIQNGYNLAESITTQSEAPEATFKTNWCKALITRTAFVKTDAGTIVCASNTEVVEQGVLNFNATLTHKPGKKIDIKLEGDFETCKISFHKLETGNPFQFYLNGHLFYPSKTVTTTGVFQAQLPLAKGNVFARFEVSKGGCGFVKTMQWYQK